MEMEEWVEVEGKTVEIALQVALEELKLSAPEEAEVEIVQEAQRGFLGLGGKDAIIKVKAKPKPRRRRRRRSRGKGEGQAKTSDERRAKGGSGGAAAPRKKPRPEKRRPDAEKRTKTRKPEQDKPTEDQMDVESQAEIVGNFLEGLLDAFGLEGNVATRIEENIIYADVNGEQTEALVGPKGSIMQAVQELTRTVVQRQSRETARIRLDIAGYGERRRSALKIYTGRLAEQVLNSGREAVLEPMNPSDRKVVHDVIAEIEGVRSFSEGEEPRRSVVVGLAPGYSARSSEEAVGADDEATESEDQAIDTEPEGGNDERVGDDAPDEEVDETAGDEEADAADAAPDGADD